MSEDDFNPPEKGICITFNDGEHQWYDPILPGEVEFIDGKILVKHNSPHVYSHDLKDIKSYRYYTIGVDDYDHSKEGINPHDQK